MSIAIVGGGLAGAAAACGLAQAGRAVTLYEREAAPAHKVCGEFVSREAQLYLGRLGIDLRALGARPISTVRLVRGAAVAATRLPFGGLSLTRRSLDAALLERAEALGADIRRGAVVRDAAEIVADAVLLATGKHELRGAKRTVPFAPPDFVGFKMYFALAPAQARALEDAVEIVLFDDSYAGLQMVEGGQANLCLLADRPRLARAGATWEGLLAGLLDDSSHLRARLDGAAPALARPLCVARVPYGFVHRPVANDPANLFRLGDQMAVIPSFSGDGMSIALHTAQAAADAVCDGRPAPQYHRQMRRELRGQMWVAEALYRCGRNPVGQMAMMAGVRLWPGALAVMASLTRVPEPHLRRGIAR